MNVKTYLLGNGILYSEIADVHPSIVKIYEIDNPYKKSFVGMPDGCVDMHFVWDDASCHTYLCCSFLQGAFTQTSTYRRCLGIKFLPGMYPNFLNIPLNQAMGKRFLCADLLQERACGTAVEQALLASMSFTERLAIIMNEVERYTLFEEHPAVKKVVHEIETSNGMLTVEALCQRAAYSQQHLNRLFKKSIGVSIKKYSGIIRMQKALCMMRHQESVGDICEDLHYYDQSHFIHEFKKYTLDTPERFSRRIATNSVQCV